MKNDNFSICVQHWTKREKERHTFSFYISAKKKKNLSLSLPIVRSALSCFPLSLSLYERERRTKYDRDFCFLPPSLSRSIVRSVVCFNELQDSLIVDVFRPNQCRNP